MRANVETETVVEHDGDPEIPARVGEILGEGGVNIYGFACHGTAASGAVHVLTGDPDRCQRLLAEAGIDSVQRRMLVTPAPNEPGTFARVARQLVDRGLTISESYVVMDPSNTMPRLAFAVEETDQRLQKAAAEIDPL